MLSELQEIIFQHFRNNEEIGVFAYYSRSRQINRFPSISKNTATPIGKQLNYVSLEQDDCSVRAKSTQQRISAGNMYLSKINQRVISVYSSRSPIRQMNINSNVN